jgi:hypothetical protein
MFNIFFFISLISAPAIDSRVSDFDEGPWCLRINYNQNSSTNPVTTTTSWSTKTWFPSGKIKSHSNFRNDSYSTVNKDEIGRIINIVSGNLRYLDSDYLWKINDTQFVYNSHNYVVQIIAKDVLGNLISSERIQYDSQQRRYESSTTFSEEGKKRKRVISYGYQPTGSTIIWQEGAQDDAGNLGTITMLMTDQYDNLNRMLRHDDYGRSPSVDTLTHFTSLEFEYSETSSDFYKRELKTSWRTIDSFGNPKVVESFYDKQDRVLSTKLQDKDGQFQLQTRNTYDDKFDDAQRPLRFETKKYSYANGTETLAGNTVTDFKYGPKGIEVIETHDFDSAGAELKSSFSHFTYCD